MTSFAISLLCAAMCCVGLFCVPSIRRGNHQIDLMRNSPEQRALLDDGDTIDDDASNKRENVLQGP